jgi:hypothetical protein
MALSLSLCHLPSSSKLLRPLWIIRHRELSASGSHAVTSFHPEFSTLIRDGLHSRSLHEFRIRLGSKRDLNRISLYTLHHGNFALRAVTKNFSASKKMIAGGITVIPPAELMNFNND